jgi:hypothetical protein
MPLPEESGVDFLDEMMGGIRPASFLGCLAESSGGKTIFGVQLATESAMRCKQRTAFFAYEQAVEGDLAERFHRRAIGITRKEWDAFMARGLDQADRDFVKKVRGVQESLKLLQIYDMSGRRKGQGNGGALEIRNILEDAKRRQALPSLVIVDWLGPMVAAMAGKKFDWGTFKPDSVRDLISVELGHFQKMVAEYRVKIMLLHQLAPGIIGNKTPAYLPSYTDAAECKSFGLLMNYVFTFGRMDPKTNCMWFNAPKARGSRKFHTVVRMDAQSDVIVHAAGYTGMDNGSPRAGYFREGGAPSTDLEVF